MLPSLLAEATNFVNYGWAGPIAGVIGLGFAAFLATKIMSQSDGDETMRKIAKAM